MVKAEDILAAHIDCHRGKASSPDAIKFEINLFENITELVEEINARTYEPLPSITFVVSRPVYREVFAANYRDRVIHHYIALRLEPLFESVFSDRTFNCRVGKGQLYGVRLLASDIKEWLGELHQALLVSEMRHEGFLYEHTEATACRQGGCLHRREL